MHISSYSHQSVLQSSYTVGVYMLKLSTFWSLYDRGIWIRCLPYLRHVFHRRKLRTVLRRLIRHNWIRQTSRGLFAIAKLLVLVRCIQFDTVSFAIDVRVHKW